MDPQVVIYRAFFHFFASPTLTNNKKSGEVKVWRGAVVLRRRWPPSPCWGAAPCRLRPVAGRGWLMLVRGCDAAVGGGLQSGAALIDLASTSGLSRPVLPRRLWRVVSWVDFLSDVISGVERALWEGCYPVLTLAHVECRALEPERIVRSVLLRRQSQWHGSDFVKCTVVSRWTLTKTC